MDEFLDVTPSRDCALLVRYLQLCASRNCSIRRGEHVANRMGGELWYLKPFLNHHGIVLTVEFAGSTGHQFLALDFGRRGLTWEIFEEFSEVEDEVFRAPFNVECGMEDLAAFVTNPKPFNFFTYDCQVWTEEALQLLNPTGAGSRKVKRRRSSWC